MIFATYLSSLWRKYWLSVFYFALHREKLNPQSFCLITICMYGSWEPHRSFGKWGLMDVVLRARSHRAQITRPKQESFNGVRTSNYWVTWNYTTKPIVWTPAAVKTFSSNFSELVRQKQRHKPHRTKENSRGNQGKQSRHAITSRCLSFWSL